MSFFDNWRVQVAMTRIKRRQNEIDILEQEYNYAEQKRKDEIFDIYNKDIDESLMKLKIKQENKLQYLFVKLAKS